jgi:hypothetical protein
MFVVDTRQDKTLDMLLLKRATSGNMNMESLTHLQKAHDAVNLRMKQDLGGAQAELRGLVLDTEAQFIGQQLRSYGSWAWLFVLTAVFMIFISLICVRCMAARKAAAIALLP